MRKTSHSGGSEAVSSRAIIERTIKDIEESLGGLNEEVSYEAPHYDSLVVFSTTDEDPIATPVATLDGTGSNGFQRYFRDTSVIDFRLRKAGTALLHHNSFAQSAINPDYQITYTHPLISDGAQVGAVQYSFTEHYTGEGLSLPDNHTLEHVWDRYQTETAAAAAGLAGLQRMALERRKTLPVMLHKKPTLAPNSFLIRWDIEGATELNASDRQPLLDDFINDAHVALSDLTQEYVDDPEKSHWNIRRAYSDQGDGAYVTLMIPDSFNTYDEQFLKDYRHYTAGRFMTEAAKRLESLKANFPASFQPVVHMNGDFGYSEVNSIGRLNSTTMYTLAEKQKKK